MTNFKGFIFDIDGTITSTNKLIFDSFNYVAKKYLNREFSEEEIISLFGPTEDVILKKWMGDKFGEAKKDYYNFYKKNHKLLADLFPNIKDVLEMLKKNNYPIGIFTGKGRESSLITLRTLGIESYFDLIITGDDVKRHKPSGEGIALFLRRFNLTPSEALMIGDAPADIFAAREIGIKVAAVVWESYAKEEVLSMNADFVFHNTSELKNFIFELCRT